MLLLCALRSLFKKAEVILSSSRHQVGSASTPLEAGFFLIASILMLSRETSLNMREVTSLNLYPRLIGLAQRFAVKEGLY